MAMDESVLRRFYKGKTMKTSASELHAPEDFPKIKHGDALVAVKTAPAWTPLTAMASAIASDLSAPLSHNSILARAYGIPTVMATGGDTNYTCDGQTVTMGGSAETVELK